MLKYAELAIEAKDEFEGGPGGLPTDEQLRVYLQDLLADQSKHDERIGWRITQVRV